MASRDERIEGYYEQSAWDLAERVVGLEDETERLRAAWTSARSRVKRARWAGVSDLRFTRNMWSDALRDLHRYRLAWLSARRRAADEANLGMEALELRDQEIARLTAELDALRESTHGAPRLEHMGSDEDGDVWRLESRT
ncbi:hypothetical protein [Streptomyces sp. NPDC086782]|uniref:hypothetical protein n=1 Tax=Streptomyces sp. NPDC086782 TaxID=3365757 RepID=UPI003825DDE4